MGLPGGMQAQLGCALPHFLGVPTPLTSSWCHSPWGTEPSCAWAEAPLSCDVGEAVKRALGTRTACVSVLFVLLQLTLLAVVMHLFREQIYSPHPIKQQCRC